MSEHKIYITNGNEQCIVTVKSGVNFSFGGGGFAVVPSRMLQKITCIWNRHVENPPKRN